MSCTATWETKSGARASRQAIDELGLVCMLHVPRGACPGPTERGTGNQEKSRERTYPSSVAHVPSHAELETRYKHTPDRSSSAPDDTGLRPSSNGMSWSTIPPFCRWGPNGGPSGVYLA